MAILSFGNQMDYMHRVYVYNRKRAFHNLMHIDKVSLKKITSLLDKAEKDWDKDCKRAEKDTLVGLVMAAESHFKVPKINMLKSLRDFKKQLDKRDNKKELINKYIDTQNEKAYYMVEELSMLDDYFPQLPKYPRMDELERRKSTLELNRLKKLAKKYH